MVRVRRVFRSHLRRIEDFTAGAGGHSPLDDRGDAVGQKTHGAVAHAEVGAALVQTPVVELSALVVNVSGADLVGGGAVRVGAALTARVSLGVLVTEGLEVVEPFGDPQHHVAVAVSRGAVAGKPPAEQQVRAGGAFADHERVAQAVGDLVHPYPRRIGPIILHGNENTV